MFFSCLFYSQQLRHDLRVLEASVGFLLITMPMPIIFRPFEAAISMDINGELVVGP